MSAISLRFGHRVKKAVDPRKLLLKQYKLTALERIEMIVKGIVLGLFAHPVGSAIYFIFTQTHEKWTYDKKHMTLLNISLTDLWDRLPNHLGIVHGYAAPAWWVNDRHDLRSYMIGLFAILLLGSIKVGFKERKPATVRHMLKTVPAAVIVVSALAIGLIAFFDWATPFIKTFGVSTGNPLVAGWLGKGVLPIIAIGMFTGLVANRILARTFDTIQLISLDRKQTRNKKIRWWWYIIYTPNYRNRYEYNTNPKSGHEAKPHGKALGFVLSVGAPLYLVLLAFGIWLTYFGPASHIHG